MAQKLDPKEIVSLEEVLLANELQDEALVNLLVKKGILPILAKALTHTDEVIKIPPRPTLF